MILGFALHGTALAQTFSAASHGYAAGSAELAGANDHKKAIKRLKKGLKLEGFSAFEASTMYQMMGNSYYATQKK